jgi:serpin B
VSCRGSITLTFTVLLAARAGAADFEPATAINQVGLDLYLQLATAAPTRNLALSPYSIESGLALAYAGADGETRQEMAQALHFPADDPPLQAAFASLRQELGKHGDLIEWHEANRLYGQRGYDFRASFLELLQGGYEAPFEPVDFKAHAEEERLKINAWVGDRTKDRIRDLIPEGGITSAARLVLVNALYFKAPWESHFEKDLTRDLPFYPDAARTEMVPTMRKDAKFDYLKDDGFTAIAIPYLGDDLQLLILLPDDPDGLGRLTAGLKPAWFRAHTHLGPPRLIDLHLPKFRFEGSTIDLAQTLAALGMATAFDQPPGSANFNRMAPRRPDQYLYISKVFQQAFIAVDEEGTEASAGTMFVENVTFGVEMNPPVPLALHVDHPFLFAVQDRASGACLFLGSVVDLPSSTVP